MISLRMMEWGRVKLIWVNIIFAIMKWITVIFALIMIKLMWVTIFFDQMNWAMVFFMVEMVKFIRTRVCCLMPLREVALANIGSLGYFFTSNFINEG